MSTELAPYRDELVAQLQATREENAVLKTENAQLKAAKPAASAREIALARLGIHATATASIFTVVAVAQAGADRYTGEVIPFSFNHPQAVAILVCLNLFFWTLTSVIRRFS